MLVKSFQCLIHLHLDLNFSLAVCLNYICKLRNRAGGGGGSHDSPHFKMYTIKTQIDRFLHRTNNMKILFTWIICGNNFLKKAFPINFPNKFRSDFRNLSYRCQESKTTKNHQKLGANLLQHYIACRFFLQLQ